MPERPDNFTDAGGNLPPKLAMDLGELYRPHLFVPPEMDQRVLAEAQRRLGALATRRASARRRWWLSGAAGVAAAAAIAVVLRVAQLPPPPQAQAPIAQLSGDIDGSGQVDILDAFALARTIEARRTLAPVWDVNGDGAIDARDVEAVAQQAVTLNAEFNS